MNLEKAYAIINEVDELELTVVDADIRYKRFHRHYQQKARDIWGKFDSLPKPFRDSINHDKRDPTISIPEAIELWELMLKDRENSQDFIVKEEIKNKSNSQLQYEVNKEERRRRRKYRKEEQKSHPMLWKKEKWYQKHTTKYTYISKKNSELIRNSKVELLPEDKYNLYLKMGLVTPIRIKERVLEPGWRTFDIDKAIKKGDFDPPAKIIFTKPNKNNY